MVFTLLRRPSILLRTSSTINWRSTVAAFSEAETADCLKVSEMQSNLPFARAKIGPFFQQNPTLGNQYTEDVTLQSYLRRVMPVQVFEILI